jgi:hypothetical protein
VTLAADCAAIKLTSKLSAYTAYEIGNSDLSQANHLLVLELGCNFNCCRRFRSASARFFPQQRLQINPKLVTNNLYPEFTTAENMHSAHHNPAESARTDAHESLVPSRLLGYAQHSSNQPTSKLPA